jgi:hypothetical protein
MSGGMEELEQTYPDRDLDLMLLYSMSCVCLPMWGALGLTYPDPDLDHDVALMIAVQIRNCDGILSNMEQLLGKFQSDLGRVSEEIRQLQVFCLEPSREVDYDLLPRNIVKYYCCV